MSENHYNNNQGADFHMESAPFIHMGKNDMNRMNISGRSVRTVTQEKEEGRELADKLRGVGMTDPDELRALRLKTIDDAWDVIKAENPNATEEQRRQLRDIAWRAFREIDVKNKTKAPEPISDEEYIKRDAEIMDIFETAEAERRKKMN